MERVSPYFDMVEDKPPFAPAWTTPMRDEQDAPIWTAAVRARANVIVTENLIDGPPLDDRGLRAYNGILYLSGEAFVSELDWWGDYYETGVSDEAALAGEVTERYAATASSPDP